MTDDARSLVGSLVVGVIAGVMVVWLASCKPPLTMGHTTQRGDTYRGSSLVYIVVGDRETQALVDSLRAELGECNASLEE